MSGLTAQEREGLFGDDLGHAFDNLHADWAQDAIVAEIEAIVARRVRAALTEAADQIEVRQSETAGIRDVMSLEGTRAMFDQQAFAYGDSARIVRALIPSQ